MKWQFRFPSYVNEILIYSIDGVFVGRHTYYLSPISYWVIRWFHSPEKLEDMALRNWSKSNMSIPCGPPLTKQAEKEAKK